MVFASINRRAKAKNNDPVFSSQKVVLVFAKLAADPGPKVCSDNVFLLQRQTRITFQCAQL